VAGVGGGIVSGHDIGEALGKGALEAAGGAIAGGASIYGTVGERIKEELASKSLREKTIIPDEIA
jgi:hypothetical protein